MIEVRVPVSRGVAELAGGRESRGCVCRIVGAVVILLMARVAQGVIQRIVVVNVTISAEPRRHGVRSGQLEAGSVVIESSVGPVNGVVTGFAGGRECGRNVIDG